MPGSKPGANTGQDVRRPAAGGGCAAAVACGAAPVPSDGAGPLAMTVLLAGGGGLVDDEPVGGRHVLVVGQVEQVVDGAFVDAGQQGLAGRALDAARQAWLLEPGQFSYSLRCGAVIATVAPSGSSPDRAA